MPTYVYGLAKNADMPGCAHCRGTFEAVQPMSAEALPACPQCGAPVERKPIAPNVVRPRFSESSAAKAGFTQYKRSGKGCYEKTFGPGPRHIRKPPK